MRVIYNGVDLMPLETIDFSCEPVYDPTGVDYLYTRVSITVRSIVNGYPALVEQLNSSTNGPPISYKFDALTTTLTRTGGGASFGSGGTGSVSGAAAAPGTRTGSPQESVAPKYPQMMPSGSGVTFQPPSALRRISREANAPLLTHQAIRHRLCTPRGKLYIFSGPGIESPLAPFTRFPAGLGSAVAGVAGFGASLSAEEAIIAANAVKEKAAAKEKGIVRPPDIATICVECPEQGCITDCKNGPSPKILDVQQALGDATTLVVVWSCEAFINEGPNNSVNPSGALLSNRFSQSHVIGKDGHTIIATAGLAVFRTDLVYALMQSPDASRPLLFMPIPQGFVREDIQVKGVEDVSGILYSYTDRQVPVNFPAGVNVRAASISAYHRQAIASGDPISGALTAYERYLGLKANRHFANQADTDPRPGIPFDRSLLGKVKK